MSRAELNKELEALLQQQRETLKSLEQSFAFINSKLNKND